MDVVHKIQFQEGETCDGCGEKFDLGENLRKHVENAHHEMVTDNRIIVKRGTDGNGEEYACKNCDAGFKTRSLVKNHIEMCHQQIREVCSAIVNEMCNLCNTTFDDKKELTSHKLEMHQNSSVDTEKKEWTTSELRLLLKKKSNIKRIEGPVSIRTKNRKGTEANYDGSASIDLEAAPFEYMKREGFVEMAKSNPNIKEIKAVRVVTADSEDVGEVDVEYIGEAVINQNGHENKFKIKMFTTRCSIQIQSKSPAKVFAELIVEFVKDVLTKRPNLNAEFIPINLEERIKQLQNIEISKSTTAAIDGEEGFEKIHDKATNKIKGYTCKQCSKIFRLVHDIRKHIKDNHEKSIEYSEVKEPGCESIFQCNICKFNTKKRPGIKQHITRQHSHQMLSALKNTITTDNIFEICKMCIKEIVLADQFKSCKLCKEKEHSQCATNGKENDDEYTCFDCSLKTGTESTPDKSHTTESLTIVTQITGAGNGEEVTTEIENAEKLIEEDTVETANRNDSMGEIELLKKKLKTQEENQIKEKLKLRETHENEVRDLKRINESESRDLKRINVSLTNENDTLKKASINKSTSHSNEDEIKELKRVASKRIETLNSAVQDANRNNLDKERKIQELEKDNETLRNENKTFQLIISQKTSSVNNYDKELQILQEKLGAATAQTEQLKEEKRILHELHDIFLKNSKFLNPKRSYASAAAEKNGRIGESDKEDEENEIIEINTTSAKENKNYPKSSDDEADDESEWERVVRSRKQKKTNTNDSRCHKGVCKDDRPKTGYDRNGQNKENGRNDRNDRSERRVRNERRERGDRSDRTDGRSRQSVFDRRDSENKGSGQSRRNGERRTSYCHFYNNYKSCFYGSECRFKHRDAPTCRDDGNCDRFRCSFYHEKQNFVSNETRESFLEKGRRTMRDKGTEDRRRRN